MYAENMNANSPQMTKPAAYETSVSPIPPGWNAPSPDLVDEKVMA
jgi:hypothetical protein